MILQVCLANCTGPQRPRSFIQIWAHQLQQIAPSTGCKSDCKNTKVCIMCQYVSTGERSVCFYDLCSHYRMILQFVFLLQNRSQTQAIPFGICSTRFSDLHTCVYRKFCWQIFKFGMIAVFCFCLFNLE